MYRFIQTQKLVYSILLTLLSAHGMLAQNTLKYDSIKGSPGATIEQVAWLEGHWRGQAFGGQIDEIWSPPVAKSMMFAFQAENNDKVTFYEFGTITEENGTLIFRFKHFHEDLKGWEEKDERLIRKLVKITKDRAYFNSFTFERISDNEINVYVLFKKDSGETYEMKFNYQRVG
ncbi:MAG: DUF6265 family protein [Bacteroidota bacterium]